MMKRFLRILGRMVGVLLILVIVILISLPLVFPRVASRFLSRTLETSVEIEGLRLHPLRGQASIRSIRIAQPEGFPDDIPLLTISHPQVRIRLMQLMKLHVQIPKIQIDGLELHVIRNAEGVINLQQLAAERRARDKPVKEPRAPRETYPTLTLTHFSLPDATVTYTDFGAAPPVVLAITNVQAEAYALQFDPVAAATSTRMPGRIRVTGTILQPGFPDGYVGVKAALGITHTDIPPVNAAARIVGFDLRSLRGLLPPGIATFLGGANLDVWVDASVAPDVLRVQNRVQTAGNTFRFNITGTPRKPDYEKSTALFNLITRPGAFLTGTVGGVADAGMAAGRTVVSTAGRASSGVVSGVVNIGRGATRTAQSAARGDLRGIGNGVVDMTYGTVTGAVDTVTGTARSVGEGLGETLSAAAGKSQTRDWEASNHLRWEQRWEEALTFATSAPYPGTGPPPPPTSEPPTERITDLDAVEGSSDTDDTTE